MTDLRPELLTAEAFQEFGEVTAAQEGAGLQPISGALACGGEAIRPGLSLLNVQRVPDLPFRVVRLERHPHATQTFLPISGDVGIVIVCQSLPNGEPALDTLRTFFAGPGQVVTYRRGLWHHRAMAREVPSTVAIAMVYAPEGRDTELFDVPSGLEIMIV